MKLWFVLYCLIEQIDGEKHFKLMPYSPAEKLKLVILRQLDKVECKSPGGKKRIMVQK